MRVLGLRRGASADDDPVEGRPDGVSARPVAPDPAAVADAVSAAVLAVPGVVRLHPGAFGTVATYLPGRRVVGVRLSPAGAPTGTGARAEVHVVLAEGADVLRTAARVHAAAGSVVGGPVHVHVEDLVPQS